MNIFITPFYINSPVCVQQLAVFGYGLACKIIREGKQFKRMIDELEKSQWYSSQELKELQKEKLKIIIRHAFNNVPYYNRLFRKLNISPSDIKDIEDLKKLPLISRRDVQANPEDFLAVNVNKNFIRTAFTSGTMGSPLKIYRDVYSINFENAIIRRQYRWAGFKDGGRKVILRSTLAVSSKIKRPPYWRYDFFQNALMASAYHLSEKNIGLYLKEISGYRPDALETVPSIGYVFAKLLKQKNANLGFKYVFTSSDNLSRYKKDFIQSQFNARVFDHYGMAERVSAIGMCEKGAYHVYPEYGITEFLPLDRCKENYFEIIGTGLNNFAMPLLRYRSGDVARITSGMCECGRNFQCIDGIEGRASDQFFVTSDRRFVPLLVCILSANIHGLIESQFIQESAGEILVKIATDNRFGSSDEAKIRGQIKNYLGQDTRITIEKVAFIPREKNGKFRQFISEL